MGRFTSMIRWLLGSVGTDVLVLRVIVQERQQHVGEC